MPMAAGGRGIRGISGVSRFLRVWSVAPSPDGPPVWLGRISTQGSGTEHAFAMLISLSKDGTGDIIDSHEDEATPTLHLEHDAQAA